MDDAVNKLIEELRESVAGMRRTERERALLNVGIADYNNEMAGWATTIAARGAALADAIELQQLIAENARLRLSVGELSMESKQAALERLDSALQSLRSVAELAAENKRIRDENAAIKADVDNCILWGTDCPRCAKMLDACAAETFRAEKAEAEVARLKQLMQHAAESPEAGKVDALTGLPTTRF